MSAGGLRLAATLRPATHDEAQAALAALGTRAGIYFGVDGGIPGLHPLQATLLHRPALCLRLFGDGLDVRALSPFGQLLLRQPALERWARAAARGAGATPVRSLRAFLRCFEPSRDVLLLGALPFASHRLAGAAAADEPFGVLFFPEEMLRRDGAGAWQRVGLAMEGGAPAPLRALPATPPACLPAATQAAPAASDDLPPGGYAAMVERALALLGERPLVSLTLSQCYRRRADMAPLAAFERLRAANPAPATFFLRDATGESLLGASPDLQLVVRAGIVQALPVCGTVARAAGAVGEAQSWRELLDEDVDAAALAVCTDALRNDLAPLCEPGSLQLLDRRRPMSLSTLVHAVDRLQGRLRAGCDAWDAIVATAAPVMVTGTPRAEALAAIAELEPSARGWYGGMVVQVDALGDALVGTILRAAAVRDGLVQVRTGGDLLATSSPAREEEESRLKTRSLWRAFGLEEGERPREAAAVAGPPAAAVALLAQGDPFAAALRDCLQGLGIAIDANAALRLVAGTQAAPDARRVVAIGDAAARLLRAQGYAVQPATPRHGELVRCVRTDHSGAFIAARSLRWRLADAAVLPGWEAWASDAGGVPQVLVPRARGVGCILFRPESLLSQPGAVQMLVEVLAVAAAAPVSADAQVPS